MPRARKTLSDLVHERYESEEVCAAVIDDAVANRTVEKIESGESTLPLEVDATRWHRRITGQAAEQSDHEKAVERIKALEERVAALTAGDKPIDPGYLERLKKALGQSGKKGGE